MGLQPGKQVEFSGTKRSSEDVWNLSTTLEKTVYSEERA